MVVKSKERLSDLLNEIEDVGISSGEESADEEKEVGKEKKADRRKKFQKDVDVLSGKKPKKNRKATRTEPSREVSEFTWSSGSKDKLQLQDLLNSAPSNKTIAKVKNKLQKMENSSKVIKKPLTEPQAEMVMREASYEDTSKKVSNWNATVIKNREAEELSFPLNQFNPPKMTVKTMVNVGFKPQNDLEREISAVLKGSEYILERKNKELTAAEEDALKVFSVEDALERRKELQKARALQSYYEAKCRRAKKIKSKKYHRIQRKEEQKKLSKVDLEALSKENPELFKKELEKAEKMRAKERASLRHRNTTKWAKNLITKGHKTKEEQDHIREQLRISRELTDNKVTETEDQELSSEDEAGKEKEDHLKLLTQKDNGDENPWLLGGKAEDNNQLDDTSSSTAYRKLKALSNNEKDDNEEDHENSSISEDEWDKAGKQDTNNSKKKVKKKKKKEKVKKVSLELKPVENILKNNVLKKTDDESAQVKTNDLKSKNQTDPLNFLKSDNDVVDFKNADEDSSDDDIVYDSEQVMNIREAFANDDVIDDFVKEKNDVIEKSKPKPVDLTLPGWGEWAGAGLKVSSKKRKRFQQDAGPAPKRKDDKMANVILSEERNTKLAKHQVASVPFPYANKEEYERSVRQPIGHTWNTPSIYNKMIEPRIKTVAGQIIEPIKPTKKLKKKMKST